MKAMNSRKISQAFRHMFGASSSYSVVVISCLTVLSLGWFGDGFLQLLNAWPCLAWVKYTLPLLPFPAILLFGLWRLKKSHDEINLTVRESSGVQVAAKKVLIIFLSFIGKDEDLVEKLRTGEEKFPENWILEEAFREKFEGGWRMPLEAAAHHLQGDALEQVIVIPSKDSKKNSALFNNLLAAAATKEICVRSAGELDSACAKWREGADYENARDIQGCFHAVFEYLKDRNYSIVEDVIIDITSGQKVGSSVATAMSLDVGRQVQYVSTGDYTVRTYDITYEAD